MQVWRWRSYSRGKLSCTPKRSRKVSVDGINELATEEGYPCGAILEQVNELKVWTYIPEERQACKRHWEGTQGQQQSVYQNR
jgi:hypothetical protein